MSVGDDETVRVDIEGDYDASELLIGSYHYKKELGGSISDLDALEDLRDLLDALYTAIDFMFDVLVVWRRIRAWNMSTGLAMGELALTGPIPGTGVGGSIPSGVATLVEFGATGTNSKGRKYLGPISKDQISSQGNIQSGFVTGLVTQFAPLLGVQVATHASWRAGIWAGIPKSWYGFESMEVSSIPAYQRRRRRGRGA